MIWSGKSDGSKAGNRALDSSSIANLGMLSLGRARFIGYFSLSHRSMRCRAEIRGACMRRRAGVAAGLAHAHIVPKVQTPCMGTKPWEDRLRIVTTFSPFPALFGEEPESACSVRAPSSRFSGASCTSLLPANPVRQPGGSGSPPSELLTFGRQLPRRPEGARKCSDRCASTCPLRRIVSVPLRWPQISVDHGHHRFRLLFRIETRFQR